MRLFGWFRFPVIRRTTSPVRGMKPRRRSGGGWPGPGWQTPAIECLERRRLLAATLSVSNPVPFSEGDAGTSNMVFVVTRSGDTAPEIKVNFATIDGTARAGVDYKATSGTLDFLAGVTSQTVDVPVIGNTLFQSNR